MWDGNCMLRCLYALHHGARQLGVPLFRNERQTFHLMEYDSFMAAIKDLNLAFISCVTDTASHIPCNFTKIRLMTEITDRKTAL